MSTAYSSVNLLQLTKYIYLSIQCFHLMQRVEIVHWELFEANFDLCD